MSRKSIFEILAENDCIEKDARRIDTLFDYESTLTVRYDDSQIDYTLMEFIDNYCFEDWKSRGHCINLDDFLESVNYYYHRTCAKEGDIAAFFVFIEIVFNCWQMAQLYAESEGSIQLGKNFGLLHDIMIECLSRYNHKAVYDEKTERVLVIEDDPAVTAVAEILDTDLSLTVLSYNHHTLQGDLDKKKAVLLVLAAKLEPKRRALHERNSALEDDVFFMLNNMNLRHNNTCESDKNYKEYVAQMGNETLEEWYDELYQMILLAFLEIEQLERNEKIKALKKSIKGGTT